MKTTPLWKMLFLAADPVNTSPLRLGSEIRDIRTRLDRNPDKIEVAERHALLFKDLEWVLRKEKPDVLHFAGHGSGDDHPGGPLRGFRLPQREEGIFLCKEEQEEEAQLIPTKVLEELFAGLEHPPLCVVLNSCYSEAQATAIHRHVPVVIGMAGAIHDPNARQFSAGFYEGLALGKTFEEAFKSGKSQMDADQNKPHLFRKPYTRVNDRRVNDVQRAVWQNPDQTPADFIRLIGSLFDRKTFAREPCIDQCTTKGNWSTRIWSAYETYKFLRLHQERYLGDNEPTFKALVDQIEQYYQRMAGLLTKEKILPDENEAIEYSPIDEAELTAAAVKRINAPLQETLRLYNGLLNDYKDKLQESGISPFAITCVGCRCGLLEESS